MLGSSKPEDKIQHKKNAYLAGSICKAQKLQLQTFVSTGINLKKLRHF